MAVNVSRADGERDLWADLGVPEGSDDDAVRMAWEQSQRELNPDVTQPDAGAAAERLKTVNHAKDILLDPEARREWAEYRREYLHAQEPKKPARRTAKAASVPATAPAQATEPEPAPAVAPEPATAPTTLPPAPVAAPFRAVGNYAVGDTVNHSAIYRGQVTSGFGRGHVVAVDELRDGQALHVDFGRYGSKVIFSRFEGLTQA